MATKRTASSVHPSRKDQVPSEPSRKKRRPLVAPNKAATFKKAYPVNELKSKIRSLKRLLERDDRLPANIKVEKERALQTAQHELLTAQKAKERSDMIGKYHKIRFFDRQKATKVLKRARKQLAACEEERERGDLESKFGDAEVDVNYAIYYPLDQHYVSLYKRKAKASDDDDNFEAGVGNVPENDPQRTADPEIWQMVRRCMAEGTLEALRNGKLSRGDEVPMDIAAIGRGSKMSRTSRNHDERPEAQNGSHRNDEASSDGKSDGGFFEQLASS